VAQACQDLPRTAITLYQSADDSNSMASPVVARHALQNGHFPAPGALRTYEFLNYYGVRYQPPSSGPVSLVPQLQPTPTPGQYALQVGVQAAPLATARPANLTFVLDTSGSMSGLPLSLLKASMRAVASRLSAGDTVSMVTWNTSQNRVLTSHAVSGPQDAVLLDAVENLRANGGTDLESGLATGYLLAQQNYDPAHLNRVILITDGWANVGITSAELIAQHSHAADQEGIYLVGVAVGEQPNLVLIDIVTDKGRGASLYVDSDQEATRVLADRFWEVMEVAARDVRLEVTMPWHMRLEEFHGEQSSTVASEVDPQHLAPGQAMVFSQVLEACDPQQVSMADVLSFRVTYKSPRTLEDGEVQAAFSLGQLVAGDHAQLDRGAAIVAYARALAETPVTEVSLRAALNQVQAANPQGDDEALNEIADLLNRALAL
jgi:Ca-activated chloride channel family protein